MDKKTIVGVVVGLIAIVVVALGLHTGTSGTPSVTDGKQGALSAVSGFPYECIGGVCDWKVTASCGQPSGTIASSTLFAIPNPWNATSTLSAVTLQGFNGATTTDFLVGTSTTPAPAGTAVATSSVSASLIGLFNIAANSQFLTTAGVTLGTKGYLPPSSGTYPTSVGSVVVGPNDYIVGFATSTNPGGNGGLLGSSVTSCGYTAVFRRGF